jgi:hypothetical protein
MTPRPGWKEFTCEGKVWLARRHYPSVPSSKAGFTEGSGRSGIDFMTDGGEHRFLEMTQPDVPTQTDLDLMTDAQLCGFLARAGGS